MSRNLISHRGNITGPQPTFENKIRYINNALKKGYEVEIDVWYIDGQWNLGHDEPQERINASFFQRRGFWVHAKSIEAFLNLQKIYGVNYFFHQKDDYTLTSIGWCWAYPGKQVIPGFNTIAVLPEIYNTDVKNFAGICSDFIENYKDD